MAELGLHPFDRIVLRKYGCRLRCGKCGKAGAGTHGFGSVRTDVRGRSFCVDCWEELEHKYLRTPVRVATMVAHDIESGRVNSAIELTLHHIVAMADETSEATHDTGFDRFDTVKQLLMGPMPGPRNCPKCGEERIRRTGKSPYEGNTYRCVICRREFIWPP
jgi:hypothetical protein